MDAADLRGGDDPGANHHHHSRHDPLRPGGRHGGRQGRERRPQREDQRAEAAVRTDREAYLTQKWR